MKKTMVSEHKGAHEHKKRFGRKQSGPKMAKRFPDTKMFGEYRFRLLDSYKTKSEAKNRAEKLRKEGKNVRVVHSWRKKASNYGSDKHKYAVYIHTKW